MFRRKRRRDEGHLMEKVLKKVTTSCRRRPRRYHSRLPIGGSSRTEQRTLRSLRRSLGTMPVGTVRHADQTGKIEFDHQA
jgi:hypothetical protein